MSTISGSRAALSISVTPLASTAAISRFSVAPTLGKSSQIVAPRRPPAASATMKPCSPLISAPIRASPADVHVQPAGADRVPARVGDPHLAPAGQQRPEHADRRPEPADQVVVGLGARFIRRVDDEPVVHPRHDPAPQPAQHLGHDRDVGDPGDVVQHVVPEASSAAAMSLRAEFLAPGHRHLTGQAGAALDPDQILIRQRHGRHA